MQVRAEQLAAHLARGCKPLYTLVGDDPLLQQEAADAIRAAARAAGCSEREVHSAGGAHFDWSGLVGAARGMSLFADAKLVEIRIPSGKPGKEGSEALQQYAEDLPEGVVTLVLLPRLDGSQLKSGWFGALDRGGVVVRIEPVARDALPAWIAQRLARQGQRVAEGEDGQRALAFFADRVEGNLLAAAQEIAKLSLLHPEGELSADQIEAAVLDVARYDVRQLGAAVLAGQTSRALRILDGLAAEGESAPGVLWRLADDLRALARVRAALDAGQPQPLALGEARVFGPGARAIENAVARFDGATLRRLLAAASVADGVTKGLRRPDWPDDPWDALRRLVLMTIDAGGAPPRGRGRGGPAPPRGPARPAWR
jgi:DNA polymerase-3 subunit delta